MATEAPTAEPSNQASAPSAEDQAFFAQVAQDGMDRLLERVSSTCLDAFTVGRKYPLAEPDYNTKRPLDTSAYSAALDGFASQRRR